MTNVTVQTEDDELITIQGANRVVVNDGYLNILDVTETTRAESISSFWGLVRSERQVVDSETKILAIFSHWKRVVVDGARVDFAPEKKDEVAA